MMIMFRPSLRFFMTAASPRLSPPVSEPSASCITAGWVSADGLESFIQSRCGHDGILAALSLCNPSGLSGYTELDARLTDAIKNLHKSQM